MKSVQLWGTVADEHDVVEAMRTDAAEELTALLAGKSIGNDSEVEGEEDEENEEEDDECTGRGRGAPPSYGELSFHFGILERAAQDSGNADAALHLSKARMAMIAAYANKRTRQADLSVSTE